MPVPALAVLAVLGLGLSGRYAQLAVVVALAIAVWLVWSPDLRPTLLTPSGRYAMAIDSTRDDIHVLRCYVDQHGGHVQLVNISQTDAHALLEVSFRPRVRELPSESPLSRRRREQTAALSVAAGERTTVDVGVLPFAESCTAEVVSVQAVRSSLPADGPTAAPSEAAT